MITNSGVANFANTTAGYASAVSASNAGQDVGLGVGGEGMVCDYSGVGPITISFILLEDGYYMVQEVGIAPDNRFELE